MSTHSDYQVQVNRNEYFRALRKFQHETKGQVFNDIILKAVNWLTWDEMANALNLSRSSVGYYLNKARKAAPVVSANDNKVGVVETAPATPAGPSLLEILIAAGKITQDEINALATPAPVIVAAPAPTPAPAATCPHTDPASAALEVYRLIHASGGHLSQANIGGIWGYSPSWVGQLLARQ